MAEKILSEKNLVVRHSALELIEHWAIAISGLVLFLTGMFELPMSKRYYIPSVPGLGWSADYMTSLYLHYAAAIVLQPRQCFMFFITVYAAKKDCYLKRVIFPNPSLLSKASLVSEKNRPCINTCRNSVWLM